MHSSSPVRTPELQLAAEPHRQENVGSHQGKISHTQGQRRSPSKMVGGPKLHLESNPIGNQLYFNLNKFFFNFKNEQNTILGKKRYGC